MDDHRRQIAVFPGTFDPVTNGHLDVIRRGAALFDELVVAVGENPEKASLFSQSERAELVRSLLGGLSNVHMPSSARAAQASRQAATVRPPVKGRKNSRFISDLLTKRNNQLTAEQRAGF